MVEGFIVLGMAMSVPQLVSLPADPYFHINDCWMTAVKPGSDIHLTFMVHRGWSIWCVAECCKTDIPITLCCSVVQTWCDFFAFLEHCSKMMNTVKRINCKTTC